jgi:hypothetical protein
MKTMKNTIFYVGGGKGGVGKSMVSLVLVQFLIDRYGGEKAVQLIETDDSNPDVGRIYKGKIPVTAAALDEDERGWILVANLIERSRDALFVINSAARSNMGIRKNGPNFTAVLESGRIPYDFAVLWPLNRQKDSVTLLEGFLRYVTYGSVYPIRNNYFGNAEDFALYEKYLGESEFLESRVTKTLDFPALADVIADDFYTGGKTIPETADSLGAFAGQSFLSWRNQVYSMFGEIEEFGDTSESSERSDTR